MLLHFTWIMGWNSLLNRKKDRLKAKCSTEIQFEFCIYRKKQHRNTKIMENFCNDGWLSWQNFNIEVVVWRKKNSTKTIQLGHKFVSIQSNLLALFSKMKSSFIWFIFSTIKIRCCSPERLNYTISFQFLFQTSKSVCSLIKKFCQLKYVLKQNDVQFHIILIRLSTRTISIYLL